MKEAYEEKEMDHFDVYRCTMYILYIYILYDVLANKGEKGGGG